MEVLINFAMDPAEDFQGFHVGIEASEKMVANALLASFIEIEARNQIVPSSVEDLESH
jgi:hypothetical protein